MSRSALRTRLAVLERKLPPPAPALCMGHRIVAPNLEVGGPPIDLGLSDRFTINVPAPGYPAVEERWHPWTMETPPLLTREDAAQFFTLIGQVRSNQPRDVPQHTVRDRFIWRNAPGGPSVAQHGEDGPVALQPLWPKCPTESQQLAATPLALSPETKSS